MSICQNCKFVKENRSPEQIEEGDYCTGLLGSDGHYTWRTPMWQNMPQEIWDAASNQMALSTPKAPSECLSFAERTVEQGE